MIKNVTIFLIGFAGTGKLTIAQEIAQKIPARIIDNHYINNPIFNIVNLEDMAPFPEEVWEQVNIVCCAIYQTVACLSPRDWNFIFTNELVVDDPRDHEIYSAIEKVAKKRKSIFVPIRLICDLEELCRRVVSKDRVNKYKTISINRTVYKVETSEVYKTQHPYELTLDVTQKTAEESSECILEWVRLQIKRANRPMQSRQSLR